MLVAISIHFDLCIGHTSIGPYYRNSGAMWKMSTITFISDLCTGVSLYHVALLVLLRCFTIARPLIFEAMHKRFTKFCIRGIWIFMVINFLIPSMICTKGFTTWDFPDDYLDIYVAGWDVAQHIAFSVPIGLIVIFYLVQLYYLNPWGNKEEQSDTTKSAKKSVERMIHVLAIATLVCYVPHSAWMAYNMWMVGQNRSDEIFDTTGKVCREY